MFSQWLELSSDVEWVGQGRPREYEMWGPRAHNWDASGHERRCGFACLLPPVRRQRGMKVQWPNNFSPQARPTGPLQGIPTRTGRERRGGGYVGNEAALQGQAVSSADSIPTEASDPQATKDARNTSPQDSPDNSKPAFT